MSGTSSVFDFDAAGKDPNRYFDSPDEVVAAMGPSDREKIEILRQWELDARPGVSSRGRRSSGTRFTSESRRTATRRSVHPLVNAGLRSMEFLQTQTPIGDVEPPRPAPS